MLIKGWYKDSLPKFLPILGNSQIGILHLDSDTFSPTLEFHCIGFSEFQVAFQVI